MKMILGKEFGAFWRKRFAIFLCVFALLSMISVANASTEIGLIMPSGNIRAGDTLNVDLQILASTTPINVIDGTMTFDKNILQITSVSEEKSILSLWVKKPTLDNSLGQLSFVGGLQKGYVGGNGHILTVTFLAKSVGKTRIDFKDNFAVYENDGKGTLVNPWLKPLDVTIYPKGQLENPTSNPAPASSSTPNSAPDSIATSGSSSTQVENAQGNRWVFAIFSVMVIIVIFLMMKKHEKAK